MLSEKFLRPGSKSVSSCGIALLLLTLSTVRLLAVEPPRSLVVGYFPQWGVYSQYFLRNLTASGSIGLLDQMNYAQGVIAENRCAIADPNADLNFVFTAANSIDGKADDPAVPLRGNFHQLQELKRRYPKLKLLISLEGSAASFSGAAKAENRVAFVSSCISMFVRGHLGPGMEAGPLFDGFDIDWEVPEPGEKDIYLGLLTEFRKQLDAVHPGLRLSIAVSAGYGRYDGFDIKAISALVDEIGVMNYDYSGPWSHQTGFVAPLSEVPGSALHGTLETTMQGYLAAGAPASKMLLGIPFYAYGWQKVADVNHGLGQPGEAIHGEHFYSYIQSIQGSSKLYRDEASQTPWLYDGDAFWTFDDPASITAKLKFAQREKLAGVMIWELSNDSADAVLLKTIANSLHGHPAGK